MFCLNGQFQTFTQVRELYRKRAMSDVLKARKRNKPKYVPRFLGSAVVVEFPESVFKTSLKRVIKITKWIAIIWQNIKGSYNLKLRLQPKIILIQISTSVIKLSVLAWDLTQKWSIRRINQISRKHCKGEHIPFSSNEGQMQTFCVCRITYNVKL